VRTAGVRSLAPSWSGSRINFYGETEQGFDAVDLGRYHFEQGRNEVSFRLTGTNPRSNGGEMQLN
jgi:hypothetical protein